MGITLPSEGERGEGGREGGRERGGREGGEGGRGEGRGGEGEGKEGGRDAPPIHTHHTDIHSTIQTCTGFMRCFLMSLVAFPRPIPGTEGR